jgi:hypothetical protein
VGSSGRFEGMYHLHCEWSRLEIVVRGHYGHKGTLTWRLSVQRWETVEPMP